MTSSASPKSRHNLQLAVQQFISKPNLFRHYKTRTTLDMLLTTFSAEAFCFIEIPRFCYYPLPFSFPNTINLISHWIEMERQPPPHFSPSSICSNIDTLSFPLGGCCPNCSIFFSRTEIATTNKMQKWQDKKTHLPKADNFANKDWKRKNLFMQFFDPVQVFWKRNVNHLS